MMSFSTIGFTQMSSDYFVVKEVKNVESKTRNNVSSKIGRGDTLKSGHQLKVLSGGNLSLLCSCGKELKIDSPGNYQVSDFLRKDDSYVDIDRSFFSGDKSKKSGDQKGEDQRHDSPIYPITVHLPTEQYSRVFSSFVWILWDTQKKNESFVVSIMNVSGKQLASFTVVENKLRLDVLDDRFSNEKKLVVKVSSEKNSKIESQTTILTILSIKEKESIVVPIDFTNIESSLDKFIMASFFEDNGLLIDALTYLQDATNQSPNVPSYIEARDSFVKRHNL
jgi:hypothetical protein